MLQFSCTGGSRYYQSALEQCPLVVVSDIYTDVDTLATANIVLPAAGWLEKDGTVTNSERRISRQRSLIEPPGEARPDWWIICEVARRMGFAEGFEFDGPAEIFAEHAALSSFENGGERDFDLTGLCGLDTAAYDALNPVQWPVRGDVENGDKRFFAGGAFYTPTRRAQLVPVTPYVPSTCEAPDGGGALVLNTGRVRDQWHTMTRTVRSARLCLHESEPFMDIHPDDAAQRDIADGELVCSHATHADVIVRARITNAQPAGSVFVPMHWTSQLSSSGRVNVLVDAEFDAVSGQPALKQSKAWVSRHRTVWNAFALLREQPTPEYLNSIAPYWSMGAVNHGWQVELAGTALRDDWELVLRHLLAASSQIQLVSCQDNVTAAYRAAAFKDGQLSGALFVARAYPLISKDWLAAQLSASFCDAQDRLSLLAGRPTERRADPGRTICACMGVGINTIVEAASACALPTVDAIGTRTGAGTGCGSCRNEIANIIEACHVDAAE
ncbi:MAG: molybdopterin dinucleotide binding domain-containing protein [Pseudomonadota bacterium]